MLFCFQLCYSQTLISGLFLLNLSVDMNHAAAPTPTFCNPSLLPPLTLSPFSLHLCQAQGSRQPPPPSLFAVLGARLGPHTGCKHGPHASIFFFLTLKINLFSVESRSGFLTDPAIIPTWGKLSILSALCIATCKKDKCFFFLPHYGGTFWGKLGFDSANFGSYCGIDIVF